jgi:excisionase family DNA binding protein
METMTATRAHSVKEAAEIIGCGATSVYAAIKAGDLKARKYGQRTLILADDLRAFLNNLPVMGGDDIPPVRTPDRRRKQAA